MRQDFVGSEVKNWRGLLIALLVIAAMCGVILLAIVIVTPGTPIVTPGNLYVIDFYFHVRNRRTLYLHSTLLLLLLLNRD